MTWSDEPVIDMITRGNRMQATRLQVEVAGMFAQCCRSPWGELEMRLPALLERRTRKTRDRFQRWLSSMCMTAAQARRACREMNKQIVICTRTCPECGKDFEVTKSRALNCTVDMCSQDCVSAKIARLKIENARRYEIDGESHTLNEWCEKRHLSRDVVEGRIRRGWGIREALGIASRPKKGSSQYPGVTRRGNKWSASGYVTGTRRSKYLGVFSSEEEAARAVELFLERQKAEAAE